MRGPGAEFAAEADHLGVDGAVGDGFVFILCEVDDLCAGVDAALMLEEEAQEAEFHTCEVEGLTIQCDGVGRIVEGKAIEGMEGIDASGWAAEDGFDASEEDGFGEGFGDVIVCAHFQAFDNVFLGGFGGEHDDRRRGGRRGFADAAADCEAVHAWEHEVEEDESWFFAEDHFEA